MKKKLIISAVAVSTTLLITLSSGVGITQGRINNTISEKVVYAAEKLELKSNCLAINGKTYVLEDWAKDDQSIKTQTITLSCADAVKGTITCSSSSKYVAASLDKSNITINGEENIQLNMKLNASASEINESTDVTIHVNFSPDDGSEDMWADFSFRICPYENYITDADVGLSSNYLKAGGQIVLMDDWVVNSGTSKMKDISLIVCDGEISGELVCASDSDNITATIADLSGSQNLTVSQSNQFLSPLKLSLADKAAELTEATTVTVRVCWIPQSSVDSKVTMWADFVVKLVPSLDKSNDVEIEETLSSNWQDSFNWNEQLQIPINCPEEATSIELTYNGSGFPERTRYTTDNNVYYTLGEKMNIRISSSEAENLKLDFSESEYDESEAVTIGATVYENKTAILSTEKEIAVEYTEDEKISLVGKNSYSKKISKKDKLVVGIHIPNGCDTVVLTLNNGNFPAGFGCSLDNERYIYYNKSDIIVLNVTENTDVNVLIDLANVAESKVKDELTLTVSARAGSAEKQRESVSVETTLPPLSVSYDISQMYIGYNGALVLSASAEQTEVRVEKLVDGQYKSADDNFGVVAGVVDGELVISNADEKADAGAYKIILARKQNGFDLSSIEIPFFIHY